MRVYLASRWGRKNEMALMSKYVQEYGHEVVSHWIDEPKMDQEEDGSYINDWHPDRNTVIDIARRDLRAITTSTHLVLFTDRSRSGITGGRHCEFGFALAHPLVQTIIVGPPTNPFHYLADHTFYSSEEFLAWLKTQE